MDLQQLRRVGATTACNGASAVADVAVADVAARPTAACPQAVTVALTLQHIDLNA